jgi:hypothetical protein
MMIGTYSRGFVVRGTVSCRGIKELSVESCVFWNIATCNPVKVIQHFRGTYHTPIFRFKEQTKEETSMKQAACSFKMSVDFHQAI